jgi:hypothetical protein
MNYLVEWQQSCVDEQLIRLNVTELEGTSPSEYLLYADALPRRNDGRVSHHILKRYEHIERGGWWCSGIDLLTGQDDIWGCFKPNSPRLSADRGKLIKYEHPPQAPTGLFALRVPCHLWQRIAARYGVEILARDLEADRSGLGFWRWLLDHPAIPLCITEGAKKAGALLSAGYAAIALPGIHSGYRVPRNEWGDRIGKSHLIPQLQKLATPGREIYLAFDRDSKAATLQGVKAAIGRMGYLLTQAGCSVKVMTWHCQLGKGVDDFIAQQGQQAFEEVYQRALPLDTWKAQGLSALSYPANLQYRDRYLPPLSLPESAQLIAIKSPKGTGKTRCLEEIVSQALARQQWVLVIGHRIRLVQELCQRFGLHYISEVRDHSLNQGSGYGLCIDSLHPNSQAQFQALNWSDGVVIIDEIEQVLWHGLNSQTCRHQRVSILKSLKTLMQNVLGGKGQVFVADADLSDISLDYLTALAGIPLQPFIVQNDWKPAPENAWTVYNYPDSTPKRLVKDLVKHIRDGGKPFICLSAQKLTSQWGTRTLESYLKKQFPQAKILRIDSESLAEPTHPACGCLANLNQILGNYDIVLASPSIETGISIDLQGHFTSVWAIAQGVQTATSVCQALGRIRSPIPRYIWVAAYGFNQVGNGSTSIPRLLTSGNRLTELNIRLLQQSDFEALDDLDTGFQAESLLCWAKMAVRANAAMSHYRLSVLALLQEEGHQVVDAWAEVKGKGEQAQEANASGDSKGKSSQNQLTEAINAIREQNYLAECEAIAQAEDLTQEQYLSLKKRLIKSLKERRALRKHDLKRRYGIPLTPELVARDDRGWYQKLRLHYFLTIGRSYLADRDVMIAKKLIEQGGGSLFLPDFNGSQLGAIVGTMEVLGIPVLLANPQRELRNTDEDLKAMAAIALRNRSEIKTVVGIGLAQTATPITIIRRLLDQIGYGLTPVRSEKRIRVYHLAPPQDGRQAVFRQWLRKDDHYPGSSESCFEQSWLPLKLRTQAQESQSHEYVQMSLEF